MAQFQRRSSKHKVALALQGGSHGAFTWGVLDRVIEDPDIEIVGVTGTSAGACNAVVLADGLLRGGPEQARRELRQFWESVGHALGSGTLITDSHSETAGYPPPEQTPPHTFWEMITRDLSPYDLNPLQLNPLRRLLEEVIDIESISRQDEFPVIVCATNARTARRRNFSNRDLSIDAVLASACLPHIFPAIIIDGDPYWDGGFTGNPAFTALIRRLPDCDLVIVRVDPVRRASLPQTPREIADRMVEIAFNSSFWLELSAMGIILKFVDERLLDRDRFGRIRFHAIEASDMIELFPHPDRLDDHAAFIAHLFRLGRITADAWLRDNRGDLGQRSTIDLQMLLPIEVAQILLPDEDADSPCNVTPVH